MIIHKINVEGFAVFKAENDTPIGAHRDSPKALQITFQPVKLQALLGLKVTEPAMRSCASFLVTA